MIDKRLYLFAIILLYTVLHIFEFHKNDSNTEDTDKLGLNKSFNLFQHSNFSTEHMTYQDFDRKAKEDNKFLLKILSQPYLHPKSKDIFLRYFTGRNFTIESDLNTKPNSFLKNYDVNSDVMIFLHIQKTGGTHLTNRLRSELQTPFSSIRQKNSNSKCFNPNGNVWIYLYKYYGSLCGLHPDWTQLHRCIPGQLDIFEGKSRKRRYFYFTQLRDPVSRYLSEYNHVHDLGRHWQDAILGCGDTFAQWRDMRPCFLTEMWKGVTLDGFMSCPYNLATNRMTRMLADLQTSNCYKKYLDRSTMMIRAIKWIESAKKNLHQMEYFGFMEDTPASDRLFLRVFKMKFDSKEIKIDYPMNSLKIKLTEKQYLRVLRHVELDIHIYLFAKDLFRRRLQTL